MQKESGTESDLLSESTQGFALVSCSVLILPLSLGLMQALDETERDYETECDPTYRALVGNVSTPDSERCSELETARASGAARFMTSVGAFILTGLIGTAMLLPTNEN